MGTKAGGRDAASESRAAAELISARLPPSPRHPPASRPAAPPYLHGCLAGVGGPAAPPSFPSRPSPAAPRHRTWAGGGGVCGAALRLSSARGRERELFVPVVAWLPHTGARQPRLHRSPRGAPPPPPPATPMPPAQGSGDWDIWKRTARPFSCHRHPPARAPRCPHGTCHRLVAWRHGAGRAHRCHGGSREPALSWEGPRHHAEVSGGPEGEVGRRRGAVGRRWRGTLSPGSGCCIAVPGRRCELGSFWSGVSRGSRCWGWLRRFCGCSRGLATFGDGDRIFFLGGEAPGWVPGGAMGVAKQGGCGGLVVGSAGRVQPAGRETCCGAGGDGDVPSWGSGTLVGQGSPRFPGLGWSGCCSLGVCTLLVCQHHGGGPGHLLGTPSKVTCWGQTVRAQLQPRVTQSPFAAVRVWAGQAVPCG